MARLKGMRTGPAIIGAFALVTAWAGTADAASFDCARANSSAEKLVCGDHGLGARDEIMAKLYAAALREDDAGKVRDEQRSWLDKFAACADAACARSRYDERIAALMPTKGGQSAAAHFFTRGTNGNDGALSVVGPQDGVVALSIGSTYVGPSGAAAGDVDADGAGGVATLKDGAATLDRGGGCTLTLKRRDASSWRVRQTGHCMLADGVTFAGVYRR